MSASAPPDSIFEAASAAASSAAVIAADRVTITGSLTAFVTSFINNPVALASLSIAALGLLTSIYFQHQRDKREARLAEFVATHAAFEVAREARELREHEIKMRKWGEKTTDVGPL